DMGIYECQLGTTPPQGHYVYLTVIEPRTEILGGEDVHINLGSTLNLTCLVLYLAKPPQKLNWLHEGEEVHYDSSRGGVTLLTEAGETTRSILLMQHVVPSDSGLYTCNPSGALQASARVHIIKDEQQAAMQSKSSLASATSGAVIISALILTLISIANISYFDDKKHSGGINCFIDQDLLCSCSVKSIKVSCKHIQLQTVNS
ncbi:unnamed protein product, partial [Meganyctiphanes norvegica]